MTIIKPTRRGLITGLASLLVAPAIVRIENIMPVKAIVTPEMDYEKAIRKLILNSQFGKFTIAADILYGQMITKAEWSEDIIKTVNIPLKYVYVK